MIKNPKIAFITTLGSNVGDEFIREGIFSFLDEIFLKYKPFYINKIDLKTLSEQQEDEVSLLCDKLCDADIIIQAGAPVYWNHGKGMSTSYNVEWAADLWEKGIFRLGPSKVIFNIAAGSCQPYPDYAKTFIEDPKCVEFAQKAAYACRWTSVRDPLASQILYSLGIDHEALPCTAFHAARRFRTNDSLYGDVIGINIMPLGGHYRLKNDINEGKWKNTINNILSILRHRHHILFIAHDEREKTFMKLFLNEGELIFHSPHWRDYLPVYAKCSMVIANRVHGAVCAAGFGRPSIIIGNDSRLEIGKYIGIPSRYVADVTAEEIIELVEVGIINSRIEKERLFDLREDSAKSYCRAIIENMRDITFVSKNPKPRKVFHEQEKTSKLRLASVREMFSVQFKDFMTTLNCFAKDLKLKQFTNWSKIWEYPWLWFNGLSGINWSKVTLLDLGSELSPMPWFLASFGARVNMVETDEQSLHAWKRIRKETALPLEWHIVADEHLPFPDQSFDIVTSFSVIEHQPKKNLAINEVARVLKPNGILAMSFDICEPEMGMTFPEWNGKALTMKEFENIVWNHPEFDNGGHSLEWNIEDIPEFIQWHLQSAPYHNYVVGAAVLRKKND